VKKGTSMFDLTGKNALVTGAWSIGQREARPAVRPQ
jgi:hypothetical protein